MILSSTLYYRKGMHMKWQNITKKKQIKPSPFLSPIPRCFRMLGLSELMDCGSGGSVGKGSTCNVGDPSSIPGSGRSRGEGHGNPTPVFLPGEFPWQRGLVGYSPWGCRVRHDWETKHSMHTQLRYSRHHVTSCVNNYDFPWWVAYPLLFPCSGNNSLQW